MQDTKSFEKQIRGSIEMIKSRLSKNLGKLKNNEVEMKKILASPHSKDRDKQLNSSFTINKTIIEENHDLLNLQRQLTTYIGKYKNTTLSQEPNEDECFNDIISRKVKYSCSHPLYTNMKFRQRLLDYYAYHEQYEMCMYVLNI